MIRIKSALFSAVLAMAFCPLMAAGEARQPGNIKTDEIVVTYKKHITPSDLSSFSKKHGIEMPDEGRAIALLESIYGMKKTGVYAVSVPFTRYKLSGPEKVTFTVEALINETIVEYCQPNFIRYAQYTPSPEPDDPIYHFIQVSTPTPGVTPNQWGVNKVHADQAFNAGLIDPNVNREVIVAVLDTGLQLYLTPHPDIVGCTINGYNVLTGGVSEPNDDDTGGGHGTHCSGIIAANTNNGLGMAGVAYRNSTWTAKVLIMPIKILELYGSGYDTDIYAGAVWAVDHGAKVLNCSFGGSDESKLLQDAMNYSYERGCVNVVAAGNSNSDVLYPAACSNVISVAATDINDVRTWWSCYGKVDLAAPGLNIWSMTNYVVSAGYDYESGTSFSAPHVAGLAALILLKWPNMSPDEVKLLIEQTADDVGSAGYDKYTGWGRINVYRALMRDYTPVTKEINTYNWPNPFNPDKDLATNITYVLKSPADVSVRVFDGGGDIVWSKDIKAADTAEGYNILKWNGKRPDGKNVSNGTYFYVLKAAGSAGKNKIVVLR